MSNYKVLACFLTVALFFFYVGTPAKAGTHLLCCGSVVAVEHKRQIRDQDILIEDGVIKEIVEGPTSPADANIINWRGRYCLLGIPPGK